MNGLRVALCADFPEERWPSMDRVAAELVKAVRAAGAPGAARWPERGAIHLESVCPPFVHGAAGLLRGASGRHAYAADRALNRWWVYPRHAAAVASAYDAFHVIDHSYAHLVHSLPARRTVVTCHDLDAFRSVLQPEAEPRCALFRMATRRILDGLRSAAVVTCDTAAVRRDLLATGLVPPDRIRVVPVGVGHEFSAEPCDHADRTAAGLVQAQAGTTELLHVGSNIPRKRIDTLLEVFAAVSASVPRLRLVRVGVPFNADQQRMARRLGIDEQIATVDFVDERTLAALYRRATLVLLPSEREGFGLPLIEALACGTPVVASDLPVLREVGGAAAEYCGVGDVARWAHTVQELLAERDAYPARWLARRGAGIARARAFSWTQFASEMMEIYGELGATGLDVRARAS